MGSAVLVPRASASMGALGGLATGGLAVSGRLLESEIIALSSHGGHHLFINRIPPRLPKEDVEKIILAQLQVSHLQVSKCSVIPQNSLKNKGYGFITLDGSPSPSDLDAIADSLNNKLQVGCRTLGVRVCTDCHSACYGEEDGCASSSSTISTPPNEPEGDDLPEPLADALATTNQQPGASCLQTAAPADTKATVAPAVPPGQAAAPMSSTSVPQQQQQQLDILQTAVAALAKHSAHAGSAPATVASSRRCKAVPLQDQRQQRQEHARHRQRGSDHDQQDGPRCRPAKAQSAHESAHPAAGGQGRRLLTDISPPSAGLGSGPAGAAAQAPDGGQGSAGQQSQVPAMLISASPHLPPLPGLQEQQPTRLTTEVPLPRPALSPPPQQQEELLLEAKQDGDCGVTAAVSASPRSVSSYSSASGFGAGSAPHSAPESVCSGSGRLSGSSVNGWLSRDDIAEARAAPVALIRLPLSLDVKATQSGAAFAAPVSTTAGTPASKSADHHQSSTAQQQQRRPRAAMQGRARADKHVASSPPSRQQQRQANAHPAPARVHQASLPAQPAGLVARGARWASQGSRAAPAAIMLVPAGPPGRLGQGQAAAGLGAPPAPPPPPSAVPQQSPVWKPGEPPAGLGPPMSTANLLSASAPSSSSWHLQRYHQNRQHQNHYRLMHQQHQRQQHQHLQGEGFHAAIRIDNGGSVGNGGPRDAVISVGGAFGNAGDRVSGGGPGSCFGYQVSNIRPMNAQPRPQLAAASDATGSGLPFGAARQAWGEGAGCGAADGLGPGVERRGGSYSGGPSAGTPGAPACLQLPVAQHKQQQLSLQMPPPSQQQQLLLQPWSAACPLGALPNACAVAQKPPSPAAYLHRQNLKAQPLLEAPPAVEPLSLSHQQQQQQPNQPGDQIPLLHQGPPTQQLQEQERLAQPTLFTQAGEAGVAAPPLGGLMATTSVPAAPMLSSHMLIGGSGPSAGGLHVGSPVPYIGSLPAGLTGWRMGSLDLDLDARRGRFDATHELQQLNPAQLGRPVTAAAAAAGPTLALSVRSAELFPGRNSSDGIQEPCAGSADSADLDPLDLEPMILQLLENDDDKGSGGGGGKGGGGRVGGGDWRPSVPDAAQWLCGAEPRNQQHCTGSSVHGYDQLYDQLYGQHPQQQHQRQQGMGQGPGVPDGRPSSQFLPPPATEAPPPAVLLRRGPLPGSGARPRIDRAPARRPHPRQQPQCQQRGFDDAPRVMDMGTGGVTGPDLAVAWAQPQPHSDDSGSAGSTGCKFRGDAPPVAGPAPRAPAPNAGAGGGPVGPSPQYTASHGGVPPGLSDRPPGHPAGPPPREQPPMAAAATVPVAAATGSIVSVAANEGLRSATRGRGVGGPRSGFGFVGSFSGPGVGLFEGARSAWPQGRGGCGAGGINRGRGPVGGGGGGRAGAYGGRGSEKGPSSSGAYGGGRGSGARGGLAMNGSSHGASGSGPRDSGGSGADGVEPQGLESHGSLTNAITQRLNP